ncbi:MAG: hypothetical protein EZS28_005368 [Streblomastix strix]|uniref:Uncharacterized protein n=1 Tax=Streblomastix strix TaxID=222440 RepID=A0A5J4WXK6_9EUKA|nr:MAG: hypothetical protein EZS28_005368 [Streblomastix strix]
MTQFKPSFMSVQILIKRRNEDKLKAKEIAEKEFENDRLSSKFGGRLQSVSGFGNIPGTLTRHLFKVPGESINQQMKRRTRCRPGFVECQHQDIIPMSQNFIWSKKGKQQYRRQLQLPKGKTDTKDLPEHYWVNQLLKKEICNILLHYIYRNINNS